MEAPVRQAPNYVKQHPPRAPLGQMSTALWLHVNLRNLRLILFKCVTSVTTHSARATSSGGIPQRGMRSLHLSSVHCFDLSYLPMKLYTYFRSSASFRVRIALALKGMAYDSVPVHIAKGEHKKEAYAGISADQLVPMLETDDGMRLSQSMAIMEYLDDIHPEPRLLPADALGRAHVRALAQSIACEIHPLNNLRVLKYLVRELKVEEDAKNGWYRHWCRDGLLAFERQLAQQPAAVFCYGNTPTMADCCLVPQIFNARRFDTDLTGLPRTMAAFDACMQLDAFIQSQPSHCPDNEV